MNHHSQILQPGETTKFVGTIHGIVFVMPLVVLAFSQLTALVMVQDVGAEQVRIAMFLLCAAIPLGWLANVWMQKSTTEIVVTNLRIIAKANWIAHQTMEMNISKVESVDIRQSVLGRMFNYGTILVRGTGGTWEPLVRVKRPRELRNAIVAG